MTDLVLLCAALIPVSAALSALFARGMRRLSLGQEIRELGPAGHAGKAGTPTMGGVVVLGLWAAAVATGWLTGTLDDSAAAVLTSGLVFAVIGAVDDVSSLVRRRSLGLRPWQKMALVTAAATLLFLVFRDTFSTPLRLPFSSIVVTLPAPAMFGLVWLVFAATTNASNLTDGLDGLASGTTCLILIGLMALVPTAGATRLLAPLAAILVGFLWVNGFPAALFLGDVGSFGLGGIVAGFALSHGLALFLPLVAGVFVLEASSVILQVACYRMTGRRLFRMAPLHHHFEAAASDRAPLLPGASWAEPTVTVRFLIVQAVFVSLALAAARTV